MKQMKFVFGWVMPLFAALLMVVGAYYFVIKAGLPHQDPTLEIAARWVADQKTGDILLSVGFYMFLISFIIRSVLKVLAKKKSVRDDAKRSVLLDL